MAHTIKLKNSVQPGKAPTALDLVTAELAVNLADKKLFTKDANGNVVTLGDGPSDTDSLPEGTGNKYFPEAPNDGQQYARQNEGWSVVTGGGGVAGVSKIIAGTNVTISPTSGVGDVTINAAGGGGDGSYTLPPATQLLLGGVKVGNGLNVTADGTLSTTGGGGGGAESLNDLTDVDTQTTPPLAGQSLVWDANLDLWRPGSPAGGGDGDPLQVGDNVSLLSNDAGYQTESGVINLLEGNNPDGSPNPELDGYVSLGSWADIPVLGATREVAALPLVEQLERLIEPRADDYVYAGDNVSLLANDVGYVTAAGVENIANGSSPDGSANPLNSGFVPLGAWSNIPALV